MLWILVVTLPLRGIAAGVALPCAIAHTSAAASSTHAMGDCDHHAAHAHVDAPALHRNAPCHEKSSSSHDSCRVCCAGHVGVAAPPTFGGLEPPAARVAQDTLSPVSSFTGWIPSRIERPPRA